MPDASGWRARPLTGWRRVLIGHVVPILTVAVGVMLIWSLIQGAAQ